MSKVHWLGAGLSTTPGIRRLAETGTDITVWNRSVDKAARAIAGTRGEHEQTASAMPLDFDELRAAATPGDVIVSMLPGDFHVQVAQLALDNHAHFVSSSYLSDAMKALDQDCRNTGLCNINEVGLDPGIDHLFAHRLINTYRNSDAHDSDNALYFRSWCGGFPETPNDFRYKFSWSPLGVLKALRSPATWLEQGQTRTTDTPWKAVTDYPARIRDGGTETFEAYPNRDSLPFMHDYAFLPEWNTQQFIRGTLRLAGWSNAWQSLFDQIESLADKPDADQQLAAISETLWNDYQYDTGEPDRVVLCVELEVRDNSGRTVWHQMDSLDEVGNDTTSAMAQLVSQTVSLAVEDVLAGKLPAGVSPAPGQPELVEDWLQRLQVLGVNVIHTEFA